EPADVLAALQAIEARGAVYSAKRVGQYVSGVFRYAKPSRGLKFNPAADLADALTPTPPARNQPSLAVEELPAFFAVLRRPHRDEAKTRLGVELVMHTVLRSNELRGGRWAEIRGDEWHVLG